MNTSPNLLSNTFSDFISNMGVTNFDNIEKKLDNLRLQECLLK